MTDNPTISLALRVVQPTDNDVFNLQFSARADGEGQVQSIAVTTDGPIADLDGPEAIAEVIEFTEGLLEALRDAQGALGDGTATNYSDSRFSNFHD